MAKNKKEPFDGDMDIEDFCKQEELEFIESYDMHNGDSYKSNRSFKAKNKKGKIVYVENDMLGSTCYFSTKKQIEKKLNKIKKDVEESLNKLST